jgi:rhodanese-related sulfurtransferase
MKKKHLLIIASIIFLGTALVAFTPTLNKKDSAVMKISAQEAKNIMDTTQGYIILDVRTVSEYESGHVPGAILIPDYELKAKAASMLKDKEQVILVYCRSGSRSSRAAKNLVDLGYTNIYDFGGIISWPYATE